MLDYVAVDYPVFVVDGQVLNPAEYEEQREFAGRSVTLLQQLPAVEGQAELLARARQLLERIAGRAPGSEVSALANGLAADVARLYRLTVAPRQAPDPQRARALFETHCVSCHGAHGRGDGPAARGMQPPPSDFHDVTRMNQRSLYGLYNTISLGVGGTPMRGYTELSESDRWGLTFLAAALRSDAATIRAGEAMWQQGAGRKELGSLKALVTQTPAEIARSGGASLDAVRAFLTSRPQALQAGGMQPLDLARTQLAASLSAYRRGDREAARQLAISAYLEGFELIEGALDNTDPQLRTDAEREMMALRGAIDGGQSPEQVASQVARIDHLLDRAQQRLGQASMSPAAAFTASLLILLREGLEAILVLAAIITFVVRTGRRDALSYIHAGWIAACVLGAITWVVASRFIEISGASREVTEGVAALLAAAMLLYVGFWLHRKASAQAWNAFIRDQVTAALGKRTLWAMAGVSFLAVYRELFEVILFYQTLWAQAGDGSEAPVVGGIAVAALLLSAIGWSIWKYGARLPLRPFFAITSGLLVVLAFVFVGQGVAALQEAGVVGFTQAGSISVPLLGIRPSAQGLAAQGAVLLGVLLVWWLARRRGGPAVSEMQGGG